MGRSRTAGHRLPQGRPVARNSGRRHRLQDRPTASGDPIPISVGASPRQLAVTDDRVYVTNYNSSDLTEIDAKSSRRIGDPLALSANPFSLAVDGTTLWVASLPENQLAKVLTGRDG